MRSLSEKHKDVIDFYFANGFNKRKAYESEYEATGTQASKGFYTMLQKEQCRAYYEEKQRQLAENVGITKHTLIESLARDVENYSDYVDLASMDNLTNAQEKKFYRLSQIYSSATKIKSIEVIAKLLGLFEPEKVEVKQVNYTVGFGS